MNHVDPYPSPGSPDRLRLPDPVILDAARRRLVAELLAHLREGTGAMVLIGEPGSGRTTLLEQVASAAAIERLPLAAPADESDPAASLLAVIARLETWPAAPAPSLGPVVGRPAGIVIDDADVCPVAVWHKLADLLRERRNAPGMPPIIFALPPEMLRWLKDLMLVEPHAFDGRVRRLAPFPPAEVSRFIRQRLAAVGLALPDLFPADAVERIAAATGGMPGRISDLCDAVITIARSRGGRVSVEMIETALGGPADAAAAAEVERQAPAANDAIANPAAATAAGPGVTAEAGNADSVSPEAEAPRAWDAPPTEFPPGSSTGSHDRRRWQPIDGRSGTLFQPRRRRRPWPWIIGAGAMAIAAVAVMWTLQAPQSTDGIGKLPAERSTAPVIPALPDRPALAPTAPVQPVPWVAAPLPAAEPAPTPPPVPSAMPPAPEPPLPGARPAADEALPAPARRSAVAPKVAHEEPPLTFAPTRPVERPQAPASVSPPPAAAPAGGSQKTAVAPAPKEQEDAAAKRAAAKRHAAAAPAEEAPAARTEDAAAPSPAEADATSEEERPGPPRPVNELIDIGDDFRGAGDLAWARKYYKAAQARGSAKATRALAETYDPRYVDSTARPDPAVARDLYDEAARHGDHGAAKERDDLDQWLDEGQ